MSILLYQKQQEQQDAFNDAYGLFTQAGYNGTQSDFDNLISTNEQAFEDSYVLFTRSGYNGSREDYQNLIGLKKKRYYGIGFCFGGRRRWIGFWV